MASYSPLSRSLKMRVRSKPWACTSASVSSVLAPSTMMCSKSCHDCCRTLSSVGTITLAAFHVTVIMLNNGSSMATKLRF